ncbi:MAG: response regulator transcription factor [Muribaculaceae bacterium]|nr:response regulator transcription factor [Muribaculaceae bacterium]
MTILKCCVIDDEPLASQLIGSYVEKTPILQLVGTYSSAQEAVKVILENQVDIVFLDIEMPQLNGMEFAKIIPTTTRIIFTTAYDQYAIQGFKVNALDYLLKPINYDEFLNAVNKALQWFELQNNCVNHPTSNDYIIVKSEYRLVQIPTADILFIEGLKDYVKIYIVDEQKSVLTLMNMKTLEQSLPSSFLRVHRSFIVNTNRIKIIERNRIVFGSKYIPVSDTYKQAFSDYVSSHLLSQSSAED